jgi:membrane fusion protein (multidrug efflux system)
LTLIVNLVYFCLFNSILMENTTEKPKRKSPLIYIIGVVALVLAFVGVRAYLHHLKYESTDNAQVESHSIPVIARVAGYIDSVFVDDYGQIVANQPLVRIDSKEYDLALVQAQADMLNAQADMANAQAALSNAYANQKVASANSDVQNTRKAKAKADLERDEALFKDGAITQKQLDDSRSNNESTYKQYTANQAQVNLAGTQVSIAQAQIQKINSLIATRKAAVDQAKLRVTYCYLSATAAGRIGKVNLEAGQYVQPGQTLFTVVNDEKYWIVANFKETQIEKMTEGQDAEIVLDGYPDVIIKGKVASFSLATGAKFSLLPPDNSTGNFVKVTQRVPVKIELEDGAKYKNILKSGLSVDVSVKVK